MTSSNVQNINNKKRKIDISGVTKLIIECEQCESFSGEYVQGLCMLCYKGIMISRERRSSSSSSSFSSSCSDEAYAWKIFDDEQYQNKIMDDTDRLLAVMLQEEEQEEGHNKVMRLLETDNSVAFILQEEEKEQEEMIRKSRIEENLSIFRDPESVAFKFVSLIVNLQTKSKSLKALGGLAVAVDDLHPMTVSMIHQRQSFLDRKLQSADFTVELAYHYTSSTSLTTIRTHGLMSNTQRQLQGIKTTTFHGASYGEGVYVALDSVSSQSYGDVLLVCGIVRGQQSPWPTITTTTNTTVCQNNTWLVLRESSQIVPLLQIPKVMINKSKSEGLLLTLRKELTDILSDTLNRTVVVVNGG